MSRSRVVTLVFALLSAASVVSAQAPQSQAPTTPPAKAPSKPALPAAIESAFKKAYPTAKITTFSSEKEDGKLQYEVESVDGTTKRDLIYLPDGTLVLAEEQIDAAAVPAAVMTALKARYPKATVTRHEKLTRGTAISYEFALKGAAVSEAEIAPDGTFISPKPVKK